MIKSFTIINHLGESLDLILTEPEKSGLAVLSVDGLGQVSADTNLTKLAGSDFYVKNSVSLKNRNVVFNLKYYGNDIEECRHTADKFFPVKKEINIVTKTTHRELLCTGIVEKNEPSIFSNKSGCQISILCPDPFMYDVDMTTTPFGGIEPKFECPFIPEDSEIVDSDGFDQFEVGNIRLVKDKTVYYTGEAETGITVTIEATDNVRGFAMYNLNTREQLSINDSIIESITGGTSICAGDKITICTIKAKKSATLLRNGITYNIINALGKTRDWFELTRGDNEFTYAATEGEYDMAIFIKHRVAYKGI